MTRIVLETAIDPHAPGLYRADAVATGVDGLDRVDDAAVAAYREKGYLLVRGAFTTAETAAALAELEAMTRSDDPQCEGVYFEGTIRDALQDRLPPGQAHGGTGRIDDLALGQTGDVMPPLPAEERAKYVRKFNEFAAHHPPLQAMLEKPALVAAIERLLGGPASVLQEMAMIKPPQGREKPWHQDHAYFNYPLDTSIAGVWIALTDAAPENGCMHVIEGAHKAGPRIHWRRRDWQICDADVLGLRQTAVPAQPGDALIFDSKLPHGTPTNRSTRYRWALQYHFVAASAVQTADDDRLAIFGHEGKDAVC